MSIQTIREYLETMAKENAITMDRSFRQLYICFDGSLSGCNSKLCFKVESYAKGCGSMLIKFDAWKEGVCERLYIEKIADLQQPIKKYNLDPSLVIAFYHFMHKLI